MKLNILYKGYGNIQAQAVGTPEELGMILARDIQSQAKGRVREGTVGWYAKEYARILREDAENPASNWITLEGDGMPFEVGTNAGQSVSYEVPFIICDVIEE